MNILKAAVSCAIVVASFGAMAQSGAPVKLAKYSTYTESDWGMTITLKAGGKAVLGYEAYVDDKMDRSSTQGTWTQVGDIVTTKFKKSTFVYKIQEQNSDPGQDCKGPYGLKPVVKAGADEIARAYLWPENLITKKGPCIN